MSQPGQLSRGLPPRDPVAELARRIENLDRALTQTQAALAQALQTNTAALNNLLGDQWVIGTGAVSAAALPQGLGSSVVSFPGTLPTAPQAVIAWVTGFVSGSSLTIVKGTQTITTTGFTVILVNTSTGAATFTNMPIAYAYRP